MPEVPQYWTKVLQALAHWVAYKKEYFHGHLLPEGAIVAELTQLISSNIDSNKMLECERMYKDFNSEIARNIRVDLAIGDKPSKTKQKEKKKKNKHLELEHLDVLVEVKRYENNFNKIIEDFEKLYKIKEVKPGLRLFQVVVGQKTLPSKLFTVKHNLRKANIYKDGCMEVRARLAKKAYSSRKSETNGVFVVLLEVL